MQRRDTAMQLQRYGEQAARGLRQSQPADRRLGKIICHHCGKRKGTMLEAVPHVGHRGRETRTHPSMLLAKHGRGIVIWPLI